MVMQSIGPRLPIDNLPVDERDHARFIEGNLLSLNSRCEEFKAAVDLFAESHAFLVDKSSRLVQPDEPRKQWLRRGMAAREAAATVFRFDEHMEVAAKNLGQCPVLQKMIDVDSKRQATRLFSAHFPDFQGIRHSGQHFAALYGSPEGFAKHASGPENYVNHIDGFTMRTVFQGNVVSLDVNEQTFANLRNVRDLYWAAFMAA